MLSSTLKALKAPIESVGCLILPFLSPWPTHSLASTCQVACSICIASAGLKNLTAHEFRAKLTTWPSFPGHSSPWIHAKCTFSIFILPHQGWPTGYLFHAIPPCSILIRHPQKIPHLPKQNSQCLFSNCGSQRSSLQKPYPNPKLQTQPTHEIQMDRDPVLQGTVPTSKLRIERCAPIPTGTRNILQWSHRVLWLTSWGW